MDDDFDFYLQEGIYHKPHWDGHQHHVAEQKLTTTQLCERVKEILVQATLRIYFDGERDVIMRYFIRWFNVEMDDVPYMVWVDEEVEDGVRSRQFFFETFKGVLRRFYVGPGMQIPKESYEGLQTALEVEESTSSTQFVEMITCQLGGCDSAATKTIKVKQSELNACDFHYKKMQEQIAKAEEAKRAKAAQRASAKKGLPKKKKMTEEEALTEIARLKSAQ